MSAPLNISIRAETPADVPAIADVVERAFRDIPYSDHREHLMVARLRAGASYIPELSLLAEVDGTLAGHILLTRTTIRGEGSATPSLSLAPLSVAPEFQRRGVGSALVRAAHERARGLGFGSVVLIGHHDYYPRFGYRPLGLYPITVPFDVPERNRMILALTEGALAGISGTVEYAPEWME